jgi:anthranilate 1,2-dioxygenase small subunit
VSGSMTLEAVARRLEIEQLYTDYAHCLDADELEAWPDFFTEDCRYRITSAENYEAGLPLGIIYATSKNMLYDRVTALREANIYEPQRYRHFVACLNITADDGTAIEAEANVMVVRIMQDGAMSLFAVGRYLDRIRRDGETLRFAEKTVVLDSRQIDTLLAIPL